MKNTIKEFTDDYRWLSNFYLCPIRYEGKLYKSVEYAYLSAKSEDAEWKEMCQLAEEKPSKLKRMSRFIDMRADWESIKIDVMRECLVQKFNQEPFKTQLIETGDCYIQEGNNWGDAFWGVHLKSEQGENNLGKLIMEIRAELLV